MCSAYKTLPRSGGILDQDSYIMWGLSCVLSAFGEKERLQQEKQARENNRARRR